MKASRIFSGTVGLREAASVVFALAALLPLLLAVFVLHRSGALWTLEAQLAVLLAVAVAVLGFVVFRLLVDRVARLAGALTMPGAAPRAADSSAIPGIGRVAEIGQIGDAFARMLDDLRGSTERLEDLVFKLGALNEVVELAARVPNMQQLLALVLEKTMRTVRATAGSIMLLDRQRHVLRVVAARGDTGDDVPVGAEVPVGSGVPGRVAQSGEPSVSDAAICLPIRVEDRIIGVISLAKSAASPTDLQFLGTLMAHVAYALENARLLEEARLSAERLQNVVQELRTAQTRLVEGETVRALGQMASGMAHHLNNLLAVVSGRLQLLLLRATEPAVRKPLETAQRAVGDAAEVVRRVLGFAAAEAVPETTRVDLNEVAADVIELTRPRWQGEAQPGRGPIEVAVESAPLPPVVGEVAGFREALVNLLLNAVDAMPEGGKVTIRTWAEGDRVRCAIADCGVGMSDEVRRRALEPFFTTKGPKRTGLGLSVAYGAVQRYGGKLEIDSAPGRGTTVTVSLFVAVPAATRERRPESAGGVRLRILVIDDEAEVRDVLGDLLQEEGHSVVKAARGEDGLGRLKAGEPFDLVLTDLFMPGMTGWDVARILQETWPRLPVGLITGWSEQAMTPEERARVDLVITKPFDREQLRETLAAVRGNV